MNRQKVVLHRARATLDKISRAASTFSSFGIPKPTVRGSSASLVHRPLMETSHVARSERSPLRIVFAENEPEGARTEGSGDGQMSHQSVANIVQRHQLVAEAAE